jgi:predicted aspartyl protease
MPPFRFVTDRVTYWFRIPRAITISALTGSLSLLCGSMPSVFLSLADEAPQQSLLQQVQQCVQQQRLSKKNAASPNSADSAAAQSTTERCIFSVIMLNPNGTVRPDASARMASLMRQTGIQMPRPKGLGQTTIPLQIQPGQSLFRVPVSIQNQQFSFLLDTGASNSVIDYQTARRLGLKGKTASADLLRYFVVGQQPSRQAPVVYTLPTLILGQTRVSQLVGIGLSTQAPPFKSDGILGLDFLSQFDLVINPKKRSLSLLRPSTPVSSGLPLKGKLGIMTTSTIYINRKGPYTFLLDTGAAVTTLSEDLSKQLGLSLRQANDVQVMGLGGRIVAQRAKLDSLLLQNYRLANKEVLVASSPVFQTLGIDGVIGQDILSQYEQHWRFGSPGPLGAPERGSLELTPISSGAGR